MKLPIQRLVILSVFVVAVLTAPHSGAVDSEVNGVFKGNDQSAKLVFVSAYKGTPVSGKETIKLVLTEKDHSKDERADLKALFGDYGSALVIGIQSDGKVLTCDVAHEAHKQKPISSPTSVRMSEFKNESGQISGKIATDGKAEAFGQTWEVNLTFRTKAP
jgi:3-oxoacyl-[acyl-carrier-protein] synthase III